MSLTFSDANTQIIRKYTINWVSDSGGNASGNTIVLSGSIARINFVPNTGVTQPTNLYDITINDSNGIDILLGAGIDLSNATATTIIPLISGNKIVVSEKLSVTISNAGNAKTGVIALYLTREK